MKKKALIISMLLCFPLPSCTVFAIEPLQSTEATATPKMSTEEIERIAENYVKHESLAANHILRDTVFVAELGIWLVSYKSESLVIGEHGFALVIYDNEPDRISVQKGL